MSTKEEINEKNKDMFMSLCELNILTSTSDDKIYNLKSNLHYWNIPIISYKVKCGQWNVIITLPYKEMRIELKEILCDKQYFCSHIARISLKNNSDDEDDKNISWSFFNKQLLLKFSCDTEYLFFDTPYIYPHNIYYLSNHEYLYNKILYSITYFKNFIETYNNLFKDGIPILYIKSASETKYDYEIKIILTSCITISYVKSEVDKNKIMCHLLIDNSKKNKFTYDNPQFHTLTLKIPREIKNNNVTFQFTTNTI